jgi:SAM-dependent methyltransferase
VKNAGRWTPGKFEIRDGRLRATRDAGELSAGSRLAADLVAGAYDRHLKAHTRGRLADLGCGKVPLYEAYRHLVDEIVCVDWEHSPYRDLHVDVACDLSQPLPFPDGRFDTVILSDVLEHLPEPQRILGEVARILAADGKLLLNLPFLYGLHEQPHDYGRHTEFALRRFAANAGLTVLELERIGGAPEVLADIAAKTLLLHLPRLGTRLALALQQCAALFLRTRAGARLSAATAAQFPMGYFLVARKPA